jgi:hypothetical protein
LELILLDDHCQCDALYWLRNHTKTTNEHWKKDGVPWKAPFPFKPFPGETRDYLDVMFDAFKIRDRLLIPKTRDMMTSYSAVGWGTHEAQWNKATVVVQSLNEEKSKKLVGYARTLWENQDQELRELHPLAKDTELHLKWADGGEFFGIAKGEDQVRMMHPTIVLFDECAFLPEFQECWDAAHPVSGQMIGISSAGPGAFANMCGR